MSWTEISLLVERAKTGDRDAFGELSTRFRQSVKAIALTRVRNDSDAEDLTQEVFLQVMKKLPQLREPRAFGGWLRRMTIRMAINRQTRRGPVFGTDPEMLDEVRADCITAGEELDLKESKAELHKALEMLKADDRATLEAFYLRGLSLLEMAEEFAAPVGTIKRRLHVARHRLRKVLGADVQDTPPEDEDGDDFHDLQKS